jgi:type IV secretory pathway VirB10-like protein
MVVYAAPASQRLAALEPALEPAAQPSANPARARAARVDPGARAERVARPDALLAEGALIPVTLETALNSDLPGPIRGIVGADVLSFDASRVLIPRGARLIGEYRAGLVRGRARLFAVWTRILTPDGVSVALQAPAMDGEGRVGIGGRRDSHFFERFGGALVLSLVDAGALAAAERAGGDNDGRVVINTGRDARRAAEIALENSVNIAPTLRAPAGAPLQAFVTRDVDFSDVIAEGEE